MNLSTGRVLIIVALIVSGLVLLSRGFGDTGTTAVTTSGSPSPSASPTGTGEPPTSPTPTPAPQMEGVAIMALNGTEVTGAAGAAQVLLVDDGYVAPEDAGDAPVQNVAKTTVYFRNDENAAQNKADATYIADTYFDGAPVKKLDPELDSVVPPTVTVVVLVGEDYATSLTQ